MPANLVLSLSEVRVDGCWTPDESLVEKVRLVGYSVKDLTDADRVWVVVNLSGLGWTAQEIADRLCCSLRLIRNIKAEHAAELATYAMSLRSQILAIAGTCRIEIMAMRQQLDMQSAQLDQLRRQRAQLIDQLQLERSTAAHNRIATPRERQTNNDCSKGMLPM